MILLKLVLFKLQCRKCPWTGWSLLPVPFNQIGDLFSASANPIWSYLFNIVSTLHNYTNNYCLNLQMWPNTVETTRTNLTCLECSRDTRLIRSMRTVCWTIHFNHCAKVMALSCSQLSLNGLARELFPMSSWKGSGLVAVTVSCSPHVALLTDVRRNQSCLGCLVSGYLFLFPSLKFH